MTVEMHQQLAQAVIDGDPEKAELLALEAVERGADLRACITELTKGLQYIGKLHARGTCSLLDLLNSTDAMKAALSILEPAVNDDQKKKF